jgi:urease accessory protein UreF
MRVNTTGGASLSFHSFQAAALGAAAAIPLVLYKLGSWQPETQADDAALSGLRKAQTEQAKPWLVGMNGTQLAAHLAMDTVPPLFLMLPAAQAGLNSSFAFTSAALGNATGVDLPEEFGFLLALVMTGVVTAAVRSSDYMIDPAQVQVVSDAVANADRWVWTWSGGWQQRRMLWGTKEWHPGVVAVLQQEPCLACL